MIQIVVCSTCDLPRPHDFESRMMLPLTAKTCNIITSPNCWAQGARFVEDWMIAMGGAGGQI